LLKGLNPQWTLGMGQKAPTFAFRIIWLKGRSAGRAWSLRPERLPPVPADQLGGAWVE
jgi:hypothetical protein